MIKKVKCIFLILILVIGAVGCSEKSEEDAIIGTWVVKEYQINDEIVAKDKIAEYMGEFFATLNDSSLVFQKSGHVKIYLSWGDEREIDDTVNYTVTDNTIELYEDDYSEYLELDDKTIKGEIGSGIYIIFYKK